MIDAAPLLTEAIPVNVIEDYAMASDTPYQVAERRARELEKFLYLCSQRNKACVPSPVIDDFWHDFILHTDEYATFCAQNFGQFIHHHPQRGSREVPFDAYRETVDALVETFGPVDYQVWPPGEPTLRLICSKD
jgi:hypothetical protein